MVKSLLLRSLPFISAVTASLAIATVFLTSLASPHQISSAASKAQPPASAKSQAVARFAHVPLHFAPNRGQASSDVRFLARGPGYTIGLGATDVRLSLRGKSGLAPIRLALQGANLSAALVAERPLGGKINYFLGNDHAKWITGIPTSAAVRAEGVYAGVDLVYYGNQNQLEHDFVLAPGVNPSVVRWAVEGADALKVDAQGNLLLNRNGGTIQFAKPIVFQDVDGRRTEVEGKYKLLASNQVGFEIASYDTSRQLVIDPVLTYSGYLAGSGADSVKAIALDSSNSLYVTGLTFSTDFPITDSSVLRGNADVFVTMLDPSGNFVYSTYIGGSDYDQANGIAVASGGVAFVTGITYSAADDPTTPLMSEGFPVTAGARQLVNMGNGDAFLVKLTSTGTISNATLFGGTGMDDGRGVALDTSGRPTIAGLTFSTDISLPVSPAPAQATNNGFDDAFVARFDQNLATLVFGTYLGSDDLDEADDLTVDSIGNTYVVGQTYGVVQAPANTVVTTIGDTPDPAIFLAKFNPTGGITNLSVINSIQSQNQKPGDPTFELPHAVALDAARNVYIVGETNSPDFASLRAVQPAIGGGFDAFVLKLDSSLRTISIFSYLGGSDDDFGRDVAVGADGSIYLTGNTDSVDFPTFQPLSSFFSAGFNDAFVTKLTPSGDTFVYSTYLGGEGVDSGNSIAADSVGATYVGGETFSTAFPEISAPPATVVNPADSSQSGGFVAKLTDDPLPVLNVAATVATGSEPSSPITFTVTRGGAPTTSALTVSYSLSGSAASGVDYTYPGGSVTIPANQTSATVTVTPIDDTLAESSETVVLTLSPSINYTLGSTASATGTILDDDSQTVVSISASSPTGSEPSTPVIFTVTRSGSGNGSSLTVTYALTGTATNGVDYNSPSGSVIIPANQASATITITPVDDNLTEGSETVVATLSSSSNYTLGSSLSATGTILDNDDVVNVSASVATGSEPSTPLTFTITRSGTSNSSALTVPFTLSGMATSGTDYTSPGGSVTIPANQASVTVTITPIDDNLVEGSETVILTLSPSANFNIGSSASATGTILDDDGQTDLSVTGTDAPDPSTVGGSLTDTFTVRNNSSKETENIVLTVNLPSSLRFTSSVPQPVTPPPATPVVFNLERLAAGASYQFIVNSVPQVAGVSQVTATVSSGSNDTNGANNTVILQTTINQVLPVVSVTPVLTDATEGTNGPGISPSYRFTRSGPTTGSLTVRYGLSGTATAGTDYVAPVPTEVTIPAGSATATVEIPTVNDTLFEGTETLILTVLGGQNTYTVGSPASGTVSIADNDPAPVITIAATVATGAEPASALQFTVTRSGSSTSSELNVAYSATGSAVNGSDYSTLPGLIKIPSGSSSTTITVTPINDATVENDETVTLTIKSDSKYAVGTPNSATGIIQDNDTPVTVSVAPILNNKVEGSVPQTAVDPGFEGIVQFTRTGPTVGDLIVFFTTTGTATSGSDFQPIVGQATIPAGQRSVNVGFLTFDDDLFEGQESIIVTVSSASGYTPLATAKTTTINILDNEQPPTITITATDNTGAEPSNAVVFSVKRTVPAGQTTNNPLTVFYTVSGTATPNSDYNTLSGQLVIPSGATTGTLTVTPKDDTIIENDETVTVTLSTPAGALYAVGSPDVATGTIQDNDTPVKVSVTASVSGRPENFVAVDTSTGVEFLATGSGQFTFSRTGPTTSALNVRYTVSGTATPGTDYETLSGTATIPAGATSVNVPYNFITDFIYEGNETVIATVVAQTGYAVGTPASATGTISDDETPPVLTLTVNDSSASEPNSIGQFAVKRTVDDSRQLVGDLTFRYSVGGTAANGTDYVRLTGTATIKSGSDTGFITVTPMDDTVRESNETVVVTLLADSAGFYKLGTPTSGTVTILDNEPPFVTITATDATASEPATDTGTFTVTRASNTVNALTVLYSISGTAVNGTDYASLSGSVVIPAGAASTTFKVSPKDDVVKESTETVIATLKTSSAYALGSPSAATINLLDNEPTVSLSSTANASEPAVAGSVTVNLSIAPVSNFNVSYSVSGTATAGSDYNTLSGVVTVPAGSKTATIVVTPREDTLKESTETVVITLKTSSAYAVSGSPATINILDNEATTSLVGTDLDASEPGSNRATITVSLNSAPTSNLAVFYTLSGTATNGSDYQTLSGQVTIPAGSKTGSIVVTPINDTIKESQETVIITLKPNAAYGISGGSITATITDNDGGF